MGRKKLPAIVLLRHSTVNGANQVSGLSFEVDDKTKPEDEARQIAVDAAKIAGFKLGRVINYSENFQGGPKANTFDNGSY